MNIGSYNILIMQELMKAIEYNEQHLRNITNRYFKAIFDVIHLVLQYLDLKILKH